MTGNILFQYLATFMCTWLLWSLEKRLHVFC